MEGTALVIALKTMATVVQVAVIMMRDIVDRNHTILMSRYQQAQCTRYARPNPVPVSLTMMCYRCSMTNIKSYSQCTMLLLFMFRQDSCSICAEVGP